MKSPQYDVFAMLAVLDNITHYSDTEQSVTRQLIINKYTSLRKDINKILEEFRTLRSDRFVEEDLLHVEITGSHSENRSPILLLLLSWRYILPR